jgi:peroxiredoxin
VIAVSVDPPEASEALRKRLDTPITFVSDRDGQLMDLLNVRHRGAMPSFARERGTDVPFPTAFLLDEGRVIRWVYRPDTYRVRAPATQVLAEIDRLG